MKTIQSLLPSDGKPNGTTKCTNGPGEPETLTRGRMIWKGLSLIYGQKFAEQFGGAGNAKDAMMVWAAATADWDDAQLTEAFRRCTKRDNPWPPTLPEFIALMKDPNRHASWEIYRALPKPEADSGKAAEALRGMRERLAKTR